MVVDVWSWLRFGGLAVWRFGGLAMGWCGGVNGEGKLARYKTGDETERRQRWVTPPVPGME